MSLWFYLFQVFNDQQVKMMKVPEQKVILCGEFGVGKSSLFRRFMTDTFVASSDRKSTIGLDHYEKIYTSAEREIKVSLNLPYSITKLYLKYNCSHDLVAVVGHGRNGKNSVGDFELLQVRRGCHIGVRS